MTTVSINDIIVLDGDFSNFASLVDGGAFGLYYGFNVSEVFNDNLKVVGSEQLINKSNIYKHFTKKIDYYKWVVGKMREKLPSVLEDYRGAIYKCRDCILEEIAITNQEVHNDMIDFLNQHFSIQEGGREVIGMKDEILSSKEGEKLSFSIYLSEDCNNILLEVRFITDTFNNSYLMVLDTEYNKVGCIDDVWLFSDWLMIE